MKLSHFHFDLPEELLAEYPSEHRDEAKLMVLDRAKQTIEHKQFKDLIDYFEEDDVMILNNTKVFPARLYGNKESVELLVTPSIDLGILCPNESKVFDIIINNGKIADGSGSKLFSANIYIKNGKINSIIN